MTTNLLNSIKRKTTQVIISLRHHEDFSPVFINCCGLDISSFTLLGVSISSNLTWKIHTYSITKYASQKLSYLSRARSYFSSCQVLTIYKSEIRPSLEYCSHVWVAAPKASLFFSIKSNPKQCVLSTIQTIPILFALSLSLTLLSSCRSFHFLSIFLQTSLFGNEEYYS